MAKQKKMAIKVEVTVNEKGELEVNGNVSPLAIISLLSDASGMVARDILEQQRAESVQPQPEPSVEH